MKTMIAMIILAFCLNGAALMVSEAFGGFIPVAFDFSEFIDEAAIQQGELQTGAGLNAALIFGDFIKGANVFLNLITFQYLLSVINLLPFSPSFLQTMQAIFGVIGFATVVYLISGRAPNLGP